MNKRILELMGRTLDEKFSHTWSTLNHQDLTVFSEHLGELIVKECINVVADAVDHREPASTYVGKMKKHFGVEERE